MDAFEKEIVIKKINGPSIRKINILNCGRIKIIFLTFEYCLFGDNNK